MNRWLLLLFGWRTMTVRTDLRLPTDFARTARLHHVGIEVIVVLHARLADEHSVLLF